MKLRNNAVHVKSNVSWQRAGCWLLLLASWVSQPTYSGSDIRHTHELSNFGILLERAQRGDATSQYAIGKMYHHGDGVQSNLSKAAFWYRFAARNGNVEAQFALGVLLIAFPGSNNSVAIEGVKWIKTAALNGYTQAQNTLGGMYAAGINVRSDVCEGQKWYSMAVDMGDNDAKVQLEKLTKSTKCPKNER